MFIVFTSPIAILTNAWLTSNKTGYYKQIINTVALLRKHRRKKDKAWQKRAWFNQNTSHIKTFLLLIPKKAEEIKHSITGRQHISCMLACHKG